MNRAMLALVGGLVLANRIRAAASPVVREVVYRPANMLDPPEIDVWLISGTTEVQAEALWCQVIAPAGGSLYEGDSGVAVWNDAGTQMMAVGPICPTPST